MYAQSIPDTLSDPNVYSYSVAIIDDDVYEGEEYFMISVVNPSGFEDVTASVIIQDNEGELITVLYLSS